MSIQFWALLSWSDLLLSEYIIAWSGLKLYLLYFKAITLPSTPQIQMVLHDFHGWIERFPSMSDLHTRVAGTLLKKLEKGLGIVPNGLQ